MIVQLTRVIFFAAGALAGIAVAKVTDWASQMGVSAEFVILVFIILGGAIGYLFGGILGREISRAFGVVEERLKEYATTDLILACVGLLVGLLFALMLAYPFRLLLKDSLWSFLVTLLLFGMCGYAGMRLALLKREEVRRAFGRINAEQTVPLVAEERPAKLLDTSAVIDGRFVDLRRTGLLEGPLRVPRFVLSELHTLSDSADEIKRARGRRGLDLLETLNADEHAVEVFETDYPELPDVDAKLVRLARDTGGTIVTVDANLTKVARVQSRRVLNVNEIAAALRPAFLPGESLTLVIAKRGKEPEQGVGYLEDGTMVVVADGHHMIGEEAETVVTSVLQTAVGRMVFARLKAS
jgi:uncharacterized protein YacL